MKKLVMGANGFLGSHVARQLLQKGEDVKVMVRQGSDTRNIDDLSVEKCYGDIFNKDSVSAAMQGCDAVYYCIVDARAWLRDPAPLYRTNVEGLRNVLDVALDAKLNKFIFTSSIVTIGLVDAGMASEETVFNWGDIGGDYAKSRIQAEELVLSYAKTKGLPAVAMCVANTYGSNDRQMTPHGSTVAMAAKGKNPAYIKGISTEVVGIEDAAQAMTLAEDKGRVGERYIISEQFADMRDIYRIAAETTGAKQPRLTIPLWVMYVFGALGDFARWLLRKDYVLCTRSIKLMHIMSPMDHSKAVRELGWQPRPIEESIKEAALFYTGDTSA